MYQKNKENRMQVQSIAKQTYTDLEILKSTIDQGRGNVNPEDLKTLILKLQHEANQLTTAMKKSHESLEDQVKTGFRTIMEQIRDTDTFKQGLGEHQNLLVGVFNRITSCLGDTKFKPRVTKTTQEQLD